MSDTDNNIMSQADFARRRKVSRATVTEYKRKGLLVMTEDGKVDAAASEKRLTSSLDPVRGGDRSGGEKKPSASPKEYMAAKTREMQAKAAKQEMETRKRAGELLERSEVHDAAFTLARQTQEAGMGIADRLSSLLAAETDAAKVHDMLTSELRQVFNEMADTAEELFE